MGDDRTLFTIILVALLVFTAIGCTEGGTPQPTTPPMPTKTVKVVKTFAVGRIPFNNPSAMMEAHQPVLDGLAKALGYDRACMVTAPNYEGVLSLLLQKKIDAAWFGTVAYIRARMAGVPVEPLVCPVRKKKHSYRGAIICRKDKPYKTLTDLKGKRVAFVEPSSASGYLFPKSLLVHAGLKIPGDIVSREFGEVDFLGKHDTVVVAVYLGKYDAGAVYNGSIENVFQGDPKKSEELRTLALTEPIYNEPIIVLSSLSKERKELIKKAFLSLDYTKVEAPPELGGLNGFEPVEAKDYDVVIKALQGPSSDKSQRGKSSPKSP